MLIARVDVSIAIIMRLDLLIGIFDVVGLAGVRVQVRVGEMGLVGLVTALYVCYYLILLN